MEPFSNDEIVEDEEMSQPADAGVVTGSAPYDAADDDDLDED